MKALAVLLIAALFVGADAASPTQSNVRYEGPVPDTLRVHVGDTIIPLRFVVPNAPGKYWWHLHGPGLITKLPYRGVVIVSP
jgi:hypothetical protein